MPTTRSVLTNSADSRLRIVEFGQSNTLAPYATAVSLHAHTNRSREMMTVVPPYLERIPLVASVARREMRAYQQRHGESVDFTKGWWHPPVRPEDVLASETWQIAHGLRLAAIVSIAEQQNCSQKE